MELMTASEFDSFLEDFEEDQKNTIEEEIMEITDVIVWHLLRKSAEN